MDQTLLSQDRFNCIEVYGGPIGYFVRATIRGHHARKFPRYLGVHDCEYLCDEPHSLHGRRITCFQVDLTARSGESIDQGAMKLHEFLSVLSREGTQLSERRDRDNAVPLAAVVALINLVRA